MGIPTGGTAPKGYRTEKGNQVELLKGFGLSEHSDPNYPPRTWLNIADSDGTVIFGNTDSPGSKMTIKFCKQQGKPYLCYPTPITLNSFIKDNNIEVLNVAGNRYSKLSDEIMLRIAKILYLALKENT